MLDQIIATGMAGDCEIWECPAGQNHPIDKYTRACVENELCQLHNVSVTEITEARNVSEKINSILVKQLSSAILNEKRKLKNDPQRAYSTSDWDIQYYAQEALDDIKQMPPHKWTRKVTDGGWQEQAFYAISRMMCNALYVERLIKQGSGE